MAFPAAPGKRERGNDNDCGPAFHFLAFAFAAARCFATSSSSR